MKNLLLCGSLFALCFQLSGQDQAAVSPIIFIYDGSGSMWGQIEGQTKMEIARTVLSNTVEGLPESQKIGLVAYGHRKKGDCEDVEFLVDLDNVEKAKITQSLQNIKPLGKTPLAHSAIKVIDKLRESKAKATIIIITDGIESCGGNICEVVKKAKAEGIDFKMHIVGFGLKGEETKELECAANAGDGQYYSAEDAAGLGEVLEEVTEATIDESINTYSVLALKNGEAIDALVQAFEVGTKTAVDDKRTYSDTGFLALPPGKYDLKISPVGRTKVSPIYLKGIQSFKDSIVHQTIHFDGGKIIVNTLNNDEGWDAVVNIFQEGKKVSGGRTYGRPTEYELNPGVYDVELKAMTIKGLENVYRIEQISVKANESIEAKHNFASGIAMIGAKSGTELVDAVVHINALDPDTRVAGSRTYTSPSGNPRKFTLNPGTYKVTLIALKDHKGKEDSYTIEVKAGETVEKISNF